MQRIRVRRSKSHMSIVNAGPGGTGRRPGRLCLCDQSSPDGDEGHLYRGSRKARRYLSQHWMHPFEGSRLHQNPAVHCCKHFLTNVCTRSTLALKALLNSSQKYHDAKDNFKDYGVEVGDVKMVLPQMMKQKDKAVAGLTSGIEGLFKKNKVCPNSTLLRSR